MKSHLVLRELWCVAKKSTGLIHANETAKARKQKVKGQRHGSGVTVDTAADLKRAGS
jgi:hypothetical protein